MDALSIHVRTRAWRFGYRVGLFISRFAIPPDRVIAGYLPRWLFRPSTGLMLAIVLRSVWITVGHEAHEHQRRAHRAGLVPHSDTLPVTPKK
jgi:hypothetical protein